MTRTLFKNATLIDVNHKATAEFSVLVNDDKIEAVEQGNIEAKVDRQIDVKGKYLLPGLIDAHIHLSFASANLQSLRTFSITYRTAIATVNAKDILYRGFTTVRDAAGTDIGFVRAIEAGVIVGPRIFTACNIISKTGGHGDIRACQEPVDTCPCHLAPHEAVFTADGIDGVRKATRETFRRGAHQIKIAASGGATTEGNDLHAPQFSLAEIQTIVEEANDNNSYVMAHAHGRHGIERAIIGGVRSIEHASFLNEDLAELMVKYNTYMLPTLVVGKSFAQSKVLSAQVRKKAQEAFEASSHAVELGLKYNIPMGFGSDVFGEIMDDQTEEFVLRAQLQSNYDVLVAATAINAEIMMQKDKLGVIKENAFANLIIVDKNPLDDISILDNPDGKHISFVMKGGEIFKGQ